ncbi:MAG: hypothetical protein V4671_18965 [Armatimonadota bacterium]
MPIDPWPREKKWSHLYTRSVKVRRAQQLGFEYPRFNERELLQTEILNVLFVCSMNKWRSPTAEHLYAKHPLLACRSAGTSSKARHPLTVADIRWADLIVVMEAKHKNRMLAEFRDELQFKEMQVLELEDRYQYMDPELVEVLRAALDPLLLVED